jgi:hypothetical protein
MRRAQPFINADVLQIITEYTAQISSILCQRCVSKRWYGAVTEAIGFLNGRNWKSLVWWSVVSQLSTHFTYANPGAIVRFMAVCLRERLENSSFGARQHTAPIVKDGPFGCWASAMTV